MSIYRVNVADNLESSASGRKKSRVMWILGVSFAAHAALLGAAFATRDTAPAHAETSRVVRVLTGRVDAETGAFQAAGMTDARIKVASTK